MNNIPSHSTVTNSLHLLQAPTTRNCLRTLRKLRYCSPAPQLLLTNHPESFLTPVSHLEIMHLFEYHPSIRTEASNINIVTSRT